MSPASPSTTKPEKPPKTIRIQVNERPFDVADRDMTARELLALVGETPDTHVLYLVKGKRERESYADRPDEPIKLKEKIQFVSVSTGPTPVS